MIFRIESLFESKDNIDQLGKVIDFLGSDSFFKYVEKFDIKLSNSLHNVTKDKREKQKWDLYIKDGKGG
jgi:hypothetical protein